MRIIIFLSLLVFVLSACDSETRYRVSVPNSKKQAYIDIQLREGGWKTSTQSIYLDYGYKTGLLTDDHQKRLAVLYLKAPSVFITYDELSTEWQGNKLVIHTKRYDDFTIDVSERYLPKEITSYELD